MFHCGAKATEFPGGTETFRATAIAALIFAALLAFFLSADKPMPVRGPPAAPRTRQHAQNIKCNFALPRGRPD
jgi:hypothetical protein